jgi:hypothetical protein
MLKNNKDVRIENYALIALLVLVVLVLGMRQGFIGSVYVQCTNFEPKSFDEFASAISSLNGAVINVDPFIIQVEGVLETYPLFKAQSSLGNLYVVPVEGMTCNKFLERVNKNPFYEGNLDISRRSNVACATGYAVINNVCQYNVCWPASDVTVYDSLSKCNDATGYTTTNFMSMERRQVLNTEAGYMFCNYENNLAIIAPSVAEFASYVSKYEVCTPGEPRQEPSQDEADEVVVAPVPVQETGGDAVKDPDNKGKVYNAVLVALIIVLSGFLIYKKLIRGKRR